VQESVEGRTLMVEEVEKHEWLQDLTEVRRAHQTCDGTVGAGGDLAGARVIENPPKARA
jgi:hypothetical protein